MAGLDDRDGTQREQLAEEQAALRRVATLVARGAPTETLFAVVAEQVAEVLHVPLVSITRYEADGTATERASYSPEGSKFQVGTRWPLDGTNVVAQVLESGRPARIDDYAGITGTIAETARGVGIRSTVGSPIVVAGRLWGTMVVSSVEPDVLAPDTEARLADFTELVATAIANGEARDELRTLADEQAALRRVATLVALGIGPEALFRAVADETGTFVGCDTAAIIRFERDGAATMMGSHRGRRPTGARFVPHEGYVVATVRDTGRAARFDTDDPEAPGLPEPVRAEGIRSGLASPIVVDGELWGTITVACLDRSLPADTEQRLADFTELVATAISNTEARARADRLAREQAALRRVAELVAREESQGEVFRAIAQEIGGLLGADEIRMLRIEGERSAVAVAAWGEQTDTLVPVGVAISLAEESATSRVLRTGEPARVDDYTTVEGRTGQLARSGAVRCVVASPIVVEGRLWGTMTAGTMGAEPMPADTESRLAQFTALMGTAIANAESREALRQLAEEQAALRRVATLVAEGAPATAVFDAVAGEIARLLGADGVTLNRYEADDEVVVLAHRGADDRRIPPGTRVSHRGENVTSAVRRSERAARTEHDVTAQGAIAAIARGRGVRAAVGTPIVVNGRLWGVAVANWRGEASPPPGTEERMSKFAELLDTAIANADSRDQLTMSRARLVTEADEARRRLVRDLHDGAQQRLVHTVVTLKLAQRALHDGDGQAESLVGEALEHAERGNTELRELAHGILPAVLTRGGLPSALDALVSRLDLPVSMEVPAERLPREIEASVYFIVAEALTNVVKHARASRADVTVSAKDDGTLLVAVRDDGIGSADPRGHGLVGMDDRVTALGGRLRIETAPGGGTRVTATLPLPAR